MTEEDRQPDLLGLPPTTPQLPDFSALGMFGGADLGEHVRQLEEIRQRRTEQESASPLVLPEFVTADNGLSLDLGEDGADLLDDARANIARGEYAIALDQLTQFLDLDPGHPEARYLQAVCHYYLGGAGRMTALGILRPLRDEPLEDPELRAGVQDLRTTLRRVLEPEEITAYFNRSEHDRDAAADRLQRFMELAPEEPEPPYLLAVARMSDRDHEAALRIASRGLEEAEGDTRRLRRLADTLAMEVTRHLVRPIVQALRDGSPYQARQHLERMDREWRELEVMRDLAKFLDDLRGHPTASPFPPPRGPADRVDRLYALLSEDDGRKSVELLFVRRFAEAEEVLVKILHVLPEFGPLNFVYAAVCVQRRELGKALDAARKAARTVPAGEVWLQRAAQGLVEDITVSEAIEKYNAAVESVSDRPSREQLLALARTMEEVRDRVPELRSIATARHNTVRVRGLAKAVDRRLPEVRRAVEIVEVSELVQRFNRWSRQSNSPGSMHANARERREIAVRATHLQTTTTDPQARRALRSILDATGRTIR